MRPTQPSPIDLGHVHALQIQELQSACGLKPWSSEQIYNALQAPHMYTQGLWCTKQDKLGAFLFAQFVCDEAEIHSIGVHPQKQNKGLGNQLLSAFLNTMKQKNINKCLLEVKKNNIAAINFYKKNLFVNISERKSYYQAPDGNPIDAFIMKRLLNK